MKPEELEIGRTYWIVRFGSSYDAIFQGELVGRSASAQKGYLFVTEGTKPIVIWAIDLPMVSDTLAGTYYHLSQHHKELSEKYLLLHEKTITNQ